MSEHIVNSNNNLSDEQLPEVAVVTVHDDDEYDDNVAPDPDVARTVRNAPRAQNDALQQQQQQQSRRDPHAARRPLHHQTGVLDYSGVTGQPGETPTGPNAAVGDVGVLQPSPSSPVQHRLASPSQSVAEPTIHMTQHVGSAAAGGGGHVSSYRGAIHRSQSLFPPHHSGALHGVSNPHLHDADESYYTPSQAQLHQQFNASFDREHEASLLFPTTTRRLSPVGEVPSADDPSTPLLHHAGEARHRATGHLIGSRSHSMSEANFGHVQASGSASRLLFAGDSVDNSDRAADRSQEREPERRTGRGLMGFLRRRTSRASLSPSETTTSPEPGDSQPLFVPDSSLQASSPLLSPSSSRTIATATPFPPSPVSVSSADDLPPVMHEPALEHGLDPDFDLSVPHLLKLFNALDADKDGEVALSRILSSLEPLARAGARSPRQLVMHMFKGQESVTQEQFVLAMQEIGVMLLSRTTGVAVQDQVMLDMFCYDYGPSQAICRWVSPDPRMSMSSPPNCIGEVHEPATDPSMPTSGSANSLNDIQEGTITLSHFLRRTVPHQSLPVRWINMVGNDASTIIRVSNAYKLHPLQIEDMLNTKERPKVEINSDGTMHIVISRLTLKSYDSKDWLQLVTDQLNICLLHADSTVITIEKKPAATTHTLLQRISYAGSKVRLNNARFLIYAMVDGIVDDVFPVLKAFHYQLRQLQTLVLGRKQTTLATAKELQHLHRELNNLVFWLHSLSSVINRLLEELPQGTDALDIRKHMEDLKDHVQTLQEQTNSMMQWAKSLNDDLLNEQQFRMNQVMYMLTMVTTTFVPLQFITGVYGMNFETLPELTWRYSYLVFWIIVLMLLTIALWFFKRRGWLDVA